MDQSVIFDLVPGLTVIAKRFDFQVAKGEARSQCMGKRFGGENSWGAKTFRITAFSYTILKLVHNESEVVSRTKDIRCTM